MLAIAHNGNLSNGIMFPEIDSFTGQPITQEYAETRARWEPLYEVTQIKGDGEAHPYLSPNDEFADFETLGQVQPQHERAEEKPTCCSTSMRARRLQTGLQLEAKLGTNPYKFGMIGSTDTHTGLATADEDNFFGKHAGTEPNAEAHGTSGRLLRQELHPGLDAGRLGYAGVWATENTREAIFDAMKRKETYATTGPRMIVRFFGGWDFTEADAQNRLPADAGYAQGRADGRRPAAPRRRASRRPSWSAR